MDIGDGWGLLVESHGGGCCGIIHLFNFPTPTSRLSLKKQQGYLKTAIADAIDTYDVCEDEDCDCSQSGIGPDGWQCAIEVVLVDSQLEYWGEALTSLGWKEVFSFHNSNSGNVCHVLYLQTNS